MKITYTLLDPTENRTILVQTPVAEELQPDVAARLMELEPEAEQVGFVSKDAECAIRLRMGGGEFCGNAAMCAAVLAAEGTQTDLTVRVSGAEIPVQVSLKKQEGYWIGTVEMPQPVGIEQVLLPGAGTVPVVKFDGISHVILEQPMPRPLAEKCAIEWCELLQADALGLMFLDRRTGRMTPLVYVPAAGTLCWEHSCASGTTAVGAYLAEETKPLTASLRQPGGNLTATADASGNLKLTGTVRILKTAEAEIDL